MYLSTAFVSSKVPLLKIIAIHQQIMTFLSNTINGAGGACVVRFVGFLNIFFFSQKSLYGLAIAAKAELTWRLPSKVIFEYWLKVLSVTVHRAMANSIVSRARTIIPEDVRE